MWSFVSKDKSHKMKYRGSFFTCFSTPERSCKYFSEHSHDYFSKDVYRRLLEENLNSGIEAIIKPYRFIVNADVSGIYNFNTREQTGYIWMIIMYADNSDEMNQNMVIFNQCIELISKKFGIENSGLKCKSPWIRT